MRARLPAVLLYAVASLAACGAAAPPAPSAPNADARAPSAPALLQAALAGPGETDAVVTLAVFAPAALESSARAVERASDRARAVVEAGFSAPSGERVVDVTWLGSPPALTVTAALVDPELPLNLPAVLDEAGPLRARLEAAQQVVFVRYVGPTTPEARPLRAAALAAAALADALGGVVVDLSTLETFEAPAFVAGLREPGWLDARVRPVIELADAASEGTLTLRTRGLARLGLPDVQMTPVPRAAARDAAGRMQRVLAALRGLATARPGDIVGGETLAACAGPAEAFDHRCVRVP